MTTTPPPPPSASNRIEFMAPTKTDRAYARAERLQRVFADYASLDGTGTAFVGDSLVKNADWPVLLPREPSLNFGVGGDTAAGVFERRDAVSAVHPARIVLLVGTNDISRGTEDEVAGWIAGMVRDWRSDLPAVGIGLCAVLPRAANHIEAVTTLNRRLADLARRERLVFIDGGPALAMADGSLNPHWSEDGLHLTELGYWEWIDEARRALKRLGVDVREAGPAEPPVPFETALAEDWDWDEPPGVEDEPDRRHA